MLLSALLIQTQVVVVFLLMFFFKKGSLYNRKLANPKTIVSLLL